MILVKEKVSFEEENQHEPQPSVPRSSLVPSYLNESRSVGKLL